MLSALKALCVRRMRAGEYRRRIAWQAILAVLLFSTCAAADDEPSFGSDFDLLVMVDISQSVRTAGLDLAIPLLDLVQGEVGPVGNHSTSLYQVKVFANRVETLATAKGPGVSGALRRLRDACKHPVVAKSGGSYCQPGPGAKLETLNIGCLDFASVLGEIVRFANGPDEKRKIAWLITDGRHDPACKSETRPVPLELLEAVKLLELVLDLHRSARTRGAGQDTMERPARVRPAVHI